MNDEDIKDGFTPDNYGDAITVTITVITVTVTVIPLYSIATIYSFSTTPSGL